VSTVEAYREMARACGYPLHLGVTAAGSHESGTVRSAIGIGSLLLDGIGDTIRVSLTSDPIDEVRVAKRILGSLGVRRFGPEVISCPTCGRCQVYLPQMVDELERRLASGCVRGALRPVTIAVMGCEVNGPGEAREADIGIAFGKGSGVLFRRGKMVKTVRKEDAISELLNQMEKLK
jgi:(E)-4-hydroxy-3-methylbut-2-enyl-diphosphate synthase